MLSAAWPREVDQDRAASGNRRKGSRSAPRRGAGLGAADWVANWLGCKGGWFPARPGAALLVQPLPGRGRKVPGPGLGHSPLSHRAQEDQEGAD